MGKFSRKNETALQFRIGMIQPDIRHPHCMGEYNAQALADFSGFHNFAGP